MPSSRQPKLPRPTAQSTKPLPNTISISSPKLTREGVLTELVKLGEELKASADPNIYPAEKVSWAKDFEAKLKACRTAWAAIHQGQDIAKTLAWLATILDTGIEANRLNLITIAATQGFGPHHWWTVKDDAIVSSHPL